MGIEFKVSPPRGRHFEHLIKQKNRGLMQELKQKLDDLQQQLAAVERQRQAIRVQLFQNKKEQCQLIRQQLTSVYVVKAHCKAQVAMYQRLPLLFVREALNQRSPVGQTPKVRDI